MAIDLTSRESLDFGSYMLASGYTFIVPIDDENYAAIAPFIYTTGIIRGRWLDRNSFEDRWCYHSREAAQEALVAWFLQVDGREPEPRGWHRHTPSWRRRPDGDPAQEYVAA